MKSQAALTNGFYKTLFALAVPIILQNLIQTFVNILDTVMVGRLGSIEIAAVGLGNQIFFILNLVLFGAGSGGAIFVSQFWGKRDTAGIKKASALIVTVSLAVSLVFTIAAAVFPRALIGLYTNDLQVISVGAKYLRIVALSYPVTALSLAYQITFKSTEHVCLPAVSTAISLVTNIVFNAIFIFGLNIKVGALNIQTPSFGVAGAAGATFAARMCELLVLMSYSSSRKSDFPSRVGIKELFCFDARFVCRVLKTAFPVVINETLWGIGISVQNAIFARVSTDAIAAFNITNTVSQLTWVFFIGTGSAAAVIIGKNIGAGETELARAYAGRFSRFMPISGALLAILLIPLSLCLPFLFNVERPIIRIARQMLLVTMCGYPLRAYSMLLSVGICRSAGDTIFTMINDNIWMWLAAIPASSFCAFALKTPVWFVMACFEFSQVFLCATGVLRVRSGKWLHKLT